jgi:hypothetical protein
LTNAPDPGTVTPISYAELKSSSSEQLHVQRDRDGMDPIVNVGLLDDTRSKTRLAVAREADFIGGIFQ